MPAPRPRSIVWIKEEGLEMPAPLALLARRGWSAHVLGFDYDRWRRFTFGRWVRLGVAIAHAAGVALGRRRATLVVGTHYAGLCAALFRAAWPSARFGVVVHSVYAVPRHGERGLVQWLVRQGLRRCDAVIVNSGDIGRRILAERLVSSSNSIFLLPDGPPAFVSSAAAGPKYAFSGGSSARDWAGLAAVVRLTNAHVDWIIACPAAAAAQFRGLSRVRVLTDVPVAEFESMIAGAFVVVAVLLPDRVAGITLIRGAQVAGAVVIAQGSPYLSEYIQSGQDGVLADDASDVARWVLKAWQDQPWAERLRQGARSRADLELEKCRDANARLADFLESIVNSRGAAQQRAM